MNRHYLRVGDVIRLSGSEYVVEMVNDSRARCQPIEREEHKVVIRDKERVFNRLKGEPNQSICPTTEPGAVIRRVSRDEMHKLLGRKAPAALEQPKQGETTEKETQQMKDKSAEVKLVKVGKGRATLVHELRNQGKSKSEVWDIAHVKFPNQLGEKEPNTLFNKIWARQAKSQMLIEKAKGKSATKAPTKAKSKPPVKAASSEAKAETVAA